MYLLAAGCSWDGWAVEADSETRAERRVANKNPSHVQAACDGVRPSLGCREITVDGRSRRYAIQRPPDGAEERAVLVDLGGPGRALFSSDEVLRFAREWPRREVLVFIEEPWVTQPVTEGCEAALSRFYRSFRDGDGEDGGGMLVRDCGLEMPDQWGWNRETHAHVVRAIVAAENLVLTGIVGTSYGAVRTEPLWSDPSVRWLILNSPAPYAATGAVLLATRREGVLDAFMRAGDGIGGRRGAERRISLAAASLAANPIALQTRTPAVDEIDLSAALVGLTHRPAFERVKFVTGLRRSVENVSAAIGQLSDGILLRYGENGMSPAMLAYLFEVCGHYNPWPERDPHGDLVGRFLFGLHSPCRTIKGASINVSSAPASTCIAHGGQDDVTPSPVAAEWKGLLPHATSLEIPYALHGSPDLARACRIAINEPPDAR